MARIETSLEANYQRSWGISEGVRDLIANAKDAEIEHGPTGKGQMVVWHKGDTLYVRTKGVTLDRDVLLMGVSSKMDRSDTIGQFGEGLVMSFLAIAREEGYGVVVTNGGERWTPAIEPSTGYKGREVLVINTRKLQKARRSYTAAISGIDKDEWEALREQFLFLDPDYKEAQSVKPSECYHRILLQSKFKGRIFVNRQRITGKPIEEKWDESKFGPDDLVRLYKGKSFEGHKNNFYRCIREGGLPVSDVFSHIQTLNTCHLCAIAARLGRTIKWDPKTEKIVGDNQAAAFFARQPRKGFEIPNV